MQKPLSLNTQLSKLRIVNNLLKQALSEIMQTYLPDDIACHNQLKQAIYSLRDIQYNLRGLKQQVHRSAHTQKMNIAEIRTYLNSLTEAHRHQLDLSCWQNISISNTELASVEVFLEKRDIKQQIDLDELF